MFKRKILVILALVLLLFLPFWLIQMSALLYLLITGISYLYARHMYHSISIKRVDNTIRAYRLQKIDITMYLENKSLLPVHYLAVTDKPGKLRFLDDGCFLLSMLKQRRKKINYQVRGSQRGEYFIGPLIIKGSDPLGFFPWQKAIQSLCRVIIYPSIYKVTRNIKSGLPGGNIRVNDKIYEDISRFKSIREYTPGDDIRRINWKASAKLGQLYSNEYLPALTSPTLLLLDLTLEHYPIRNRYAIIEKTIETAASLVFYFINLKQEIGIISSGLIQNIPLNIPVRGGHNHAMTILENLSLIKVCAESTDIINQFNTVKFYLPAGIRLILIGPYLKQQQTAGIVSGIRSTKKTRTSIEIFQVDSSRHKTVQVNRSVKIYSINLADEDLINA